MTIRKYDPLEEARKYKYVRELAGNRGQRVGGIQYWASGSIGLGKPWCADFATWILDVCYQGQSPIPRTASCDEILAVATASGFVTQTPVPGDLYLRVKDGNDAHHVGFVTQFAFGQGHFGSISGNTNEGDSDEGTGVFERDVTALAGDVFVHIPS